MKRRAKGKADTGTGQLFIRWPEVSVGDSTVSADPESLGTSPPATSSVVSEPGPAADPHDAPELVQKLLWDFKRTFPQPTDAASETGIISPEDTTSEAIASIHEQHANQALAVLQDWDRLLDARRRGVDPGTGQPPRSDAAKERLHRLFDRVPARMESAWRALIDIYQDAFGSEAADAFEKYIRARHAGIPVVLDKPTEVPNLTGLGGPSTRRRRVSARLPVPRPLPSAVAAGHFGEDDKGPIRPSAQEVREITETYAQKLIELLHDIRKDRSVQGSEPTPRNPLSEDFRLAIQVYAEDFGEDAARQLEAYVRLQVSPSSNRNR